MISIAWVTPIFLFGMVCGMLFAKTLIQWSDDTVKKVLDTPLDSFKEPRR